MDIVETEAAYEVYADVPGMDIDGERGGRGRGRGWGRRVGAAAMRARAPPPRRPHQLTKHPPKPTNKHKNKNTQRNKLKDIKIEVDNERIEISGEHRGVRREVRWRRRR